VPPPLPAVPLLNAQRSILPPHWRPTITWRLHGLFYCLHSQPYSPAVTASASSIFSDARADGLNGRFLFVTFGLAALRAICLRALPCGTAGETAGEGQGRRWDGFPLRQTCATPYRPGAGEAGRMQAFTPPAPNTLPHPRCLPHHPTTAPTHTTRTQKTRWALFALAFVGTLSGAAWLALRQTPLRLWRLYLPLPLRYTCLHCHLLRTPPYVALRWTTHRTPGIHCALRLFFVATRVNNGISDYFALNTACTTHRDAGVVDFNDALAILARAVNWNGR